MADNLRAGVRARVHSLKAATQYNDAEGHLLEWNDKKGRWDVRLNSGEVLSVRPANLGLPGGIAGNGTQRWQAAEEKIKEWKDVQEEAMLEAKQFVDSLDPAQDEKQIVMSLLLPYSAADFDEAKRLKFQNAISAASGASAADVNVGQVTEMRPSTVMATVTRTKATGRHLCTKKYAVSDSGCPNVLSMKPLPLSNLFTSQLMLITCRSRRHAYSHTNRYREPTRTSDQPPIQRGMKPTTLSSSPVVNTAFLAVFELRWVGLFHEWCFPPHAPLAQPQIPHRRQ